MTDMVKKDRQGRKALTRENVISARIDYVTGLGINDIAIKYGVPKAGVADAVYGRSHTYLFDESLGPSLQEIKAARRLKPGAKITQEKADEIKTRLANGETGRSIAKLYGIHFGTVSDIKLGKIWK